MKKLKIAILSCFVIGALALTALSQSTVGTGNTGPSTYTPILLPLPTATLAASTATNFPSGGWQVITSVTNIVGSLYTNNLNGTGNPGFYTATNIVSYTNTTYARFFMVSQSRVSLEWVGSASVNPGTNIFTLARSVTGRNPENVNLTYWTNIVANGIGTNTISMTTLAADSVGGSGWIYIVGQTNAAGSGIITNADGGVYVGSKPRIE